MTRERFLTVKQPWASLIMAGIKDMENRSKAFPSTVELPARIWIHAGATYDTARFEDAFALFLAWGARGWSPAMFILGSSRTPNVAAAIGFPRGVLVGHVTITGSHHARECDRWCSIPEADRAQAGITGPAHCSTWAQPDVFHWTLTDPVALPEPLPLKGMLGLPFLPDDVQTAAYAQLQGVAA